jgi:hypothetical protein
VSRVPHIELLFWEGCPSHPRALADLRTALVDIGLDPNAIVPVEIRDDADAERERFTGSPTIRVDGADVVPSAGEPVQLACRVYRRRDGRSSPVPDPDDLRDALRRAAPLSEGAAP